MPKETTEGVTVKKSEDMAEWYSQVIQKAELAEASTVQGFMVIRPNGYSMWEAIQNYFNDRLLELDVSNAYFPLLIPESFFKKEAEHAEGFDPELAWVNRNDESGERLAIRPTSETIMYDSYSRWIRSHRDLPLKINQWCNVLRWEVSQTKIFLRTREFLWQEGHCVFETEKECDSNVHQMLDEYEKLCKDLLAIPVLKGVKTEGEKFAGAKYTTTIEALMPDGKALQMGTSHNLGQGFAKSFGISFKGTDEKDHLPWQSSWGVSTRLLGAVIMMHGDDKGLVLPPRVAKHKIAMIPILFDKTKDSVLDSLYDIAKKLKKFNPIVDDSEENSPGWKYNNYEMKGIPLRIEIGPKDVEKKHVVVVRRDTGKKEFVPVKDITKRVPELLDEIHDNLYTVAKKNLDDSIVHVKTLAELKKVVSQGKIALAPFCGNVSDEAEIKTYTNGGTPRCIAEELKDDSVDCIMGKDKAKYRVYFSKNY